MSAKFKGVRALARSRQRQSILFFALAVFSVLVPIVAAAMLVQKLAAWLGLFCICIAVFRLLWRMGEERLNDSRRAESGATGEDEVANLLALQLPPDWKVTRNLVVDKYGDIDFFVLSPENVAFAIEVKSHSGTVADSGDTLYRLINGQSRQFEKDILGQAMRQAIGAKERMDLGFVVAVLVFTRAKLSLSERKKRNVYIVESHRLVEFLLKKNKVDSERRKLAHTVAAGAAVKKQANHNNHKPKRYSSIEE